MDQLAAVGWLVRRTVGVIPVQDTGPGVWGCEGCEGQCRLEWSVESIKQSRWSIYAMLPPAHQGAAALQEPHVTRPAGGLTAPYTSQPF